MSYSKDRPFIKVDLTSDVNHKFENINSQLAQTEKKLTGYVNILEYEHLKNGDDWANAFGAAIQENDSIFVPFGSYKISKPIKINKSVVIISDNGKLSPLSSYHSGFVIEDCENVILDGLAFEGFLNTTDERLFNTINILNGKHVTVRNCVFTDSANNSAIRIGYKETHDGYIPSESCKVYDNEIINTVTQGVGVGIEAIRTNNVVIKDNRISKCRSYGGIRVCGVENAQVKDNYVEDSSYIATIQGFGTSGSVPNGNPKTKKCSFINNIGVGNSEGVRVGFDTINSNISNNKVNGTHGDGLLIHNKCTSCVFDSNAVIGGRYGIQISGESGEIVDILVLNNVIREVSRGFNIAGMVKNVTLQNNETTTTSHRAINVVSRGEYVIDKLLIIGNRFKDIIGSGGVRLDTDNMKMGFVLVKDNEFYKDNDIGGIGLQVTGSNGVENGHAINNFISARFSTDIDATFTQEGNYSI